MKKNSIKTWRKFSFIFRKLLVQWVSRWLNSLNKSSSIHWCILKVGARGTECLLNLTTRVLYQFPQFLLPLQALLTFMVSTYIAEKVKAAFVRDFCLLYPVLPTYWLSTEANLILKFFSQFQETWFCTLHWPLLLHIISSLFLLEKDLLGPVSLSLSAINECVNMFQSK